MQPATCYLSYPDSQEVQFEGGGESVIPDHITLLAYLLAGDVKPPPPFSGYVSGEPFCEAAS